MRLDYETKVGHFSERTDDELMSDIKAMVSELTEPHSIYTLNGIRESIQAAESVQLARKLQRRRR